MLGALYNKLEKLESFRKFLEKYKVVKIFRK